MTGLRELKKSQLRQTIAEQAMALFDRHGFDAVTVEEIAQAAQVSKKTVFNYFPTKEDLVFAYVERREEALLAAVAASVELGAIEAFRQLCLRQRELIPRLRARNGPGSGGVSDLVQQHASLHRRLLEINSELTRTVAAAFAELRQVDPHDPLCHVIAVALVGAQGTFYRSLRRLIASGADDATIKRAHMRDVNRVFDQLAAGLADFP